MLGQYWCCVGVSLGPAVLQQTESWLALPRHIPSTAKAIPATALSVPLPGRFIASRIPLGRVEGNVPEDGDCIDQSNHNSGKMVEHSPKIPRRCWPDGSKMPQHTHLGPTYVDIIKNTRFPYVFPHFDANLPGNGTESVVLELRGLSMRCDMNVLSLRSL